MSLHAEGNVVYFFGDRKPAGELVEPLLRRPVQLGLGSRDPEGGSDLEAQVAELSRELLQLGQPLPHLGRSTLTRRDAQEGEEYFGDEIVPTRGGGGVLGGNRELQCAVDHPETENRTTES